MFKKTSICVLSILMATNIIIIAESYCPICLLVLVSLTDYNDLSVLVIENLIVQSSLILFAKWLQKNVPFNRYQIFISDFLTWALLILYIRFTDCGTNISDFPGSLFVGRLYSCSSQLVWASSFILYTVILLFVEYILCVLLCSKINITSGFHKNSVLLIFVLTCLILIFNGKGIEATFSPQSISCDISGEDMNVIVEKDSGQVFIKLSKMSATDKSDETVIQFTHLDKDATFCFDLRNDTVFICSHIFDIKTIKKGKIAISDNCISCIPPEILKRQRRITCIVHNYPLDIFYKYN